MSFKKPNLLYEYNALEPYIDTETMKFHHEKHHTAYVNGLSSLPDSMSCNTKLHDFLSNLMKNSGLSESEKEILSKHGGGHYNHSLFWEYMAPGANDTKMSSLVKDRIVNDFGSLDKFKDQFNKSSITVFGSGWCWWVYNMESKHSEIITTKDQINPIMLNKNYVCLLGLDVWEHAYYLKFQSRRAEYVETWWKVVNWELVSKIHDELAVNNKQVVLSTDGYIVFEK